AGRIGPGGEASAEGWMTQSSAAGLPRVSTYRTILNVARTSSSAGPTAAAVHSFETGGQQVLPVINPPETVMVQLPVSSPLRTVSDCVMPVAGRPTSPGRSTL